MCNLESLDSAKIIDRSSGCDDWKKADAWRPLLRLEIRCFGGMPPTQLRS